MEKKIIEKCLRGLFIIPAVVMQRILCTNASSVSIHSLQVLPIEIDLAESVIHRKIFINGSRPRRLQKKLQRVHCTEADFLVILYVHVHIKPEVLSPEADLGPRPPKQTKDREKN
jgi:hypothetical protein